MQNGVKEPEEERPEYIKPLSRNWIRSEMGNSGFLSPP